MAANLPPEKQKLGSHQNARHRLPLDQAGGPAPFHLRLGLVPSLGFHFNTNTLYKGPRRTASPNGSNGQNEFQTCPVVPVQKPSTQLRLMDPETKVIIGREKGYRLRKTKSRTGRFALGNWTRAVCPWHGLRRAADLKLGELGRQRLLRASPQRPRVSTSEWRFAWETAQSYYQTFVHSQTHLYEHGCFHLHVLERVP